MSAPLPHGPAQTGPFPHWMAKGIDKGNSEQAQESH